MAMVPPLKTRVIPSAKCHNTKEHPKQVYDAAAASAAYLLNQIPSFCKENP